MYFADIFFQFITSTIVLNTVYNFIINQYNKV